MMRVHCLQKLTGRVSPGDIDRSVRELPERLGGLNIINVETEAAQKFNDSERLCESLHENFLLSDTDLDGAASRQKRASTEKQKENDRRAARKKDVVL